ENGRVEVRDQNGAVVRSGDSGSPATTGPLMVKGANGDLILVGTKSGLTTFNAADMTALSSVSLNNDAPIGTLAAEDLDGDGVPEVLMVTARGQVVALKAADGKVLWQSVVGTDADRFAFVDVDSDHVLDVVISGGQTFAIALSGRDGSVVWKDSE